MQSTENKSVRELEPREIADAKELFLKHGKAGLSRIVQEMHDRGWKKFGLSHLCGRSQIGKHEARVGLIEEHGWEMERQGEEETRRQGEGETRGHGGEAADAKAVATESLPPCPSHHPVTQKARATPPQAGRELTPPNQGGESKEPTTFKEWLIRTKPEWHWYWKYQKYIYKALGRFERGRAKRLMVFMPPRHGKSEMITVRYAAWVLINRPQTRIIIGSYNQKLANRFSRKIRKIFLECGMQNAECGIRIENADTNGPYPETPGDHQKAISHSAFRVPHLISTADEWETPEGGGVKAVGAGAGVTGFGADLIIIDDPIKGRADAESKNNRERVWEWYCDDLHTRLEPKGKIILIQTRWHEDDLAGRLLKEQEGEGEQWDVIRLPALAEGERDEGRGKRNEGEEEKEDLPANGRERTRIAKEVIQDSDSIRVSSCDFVVPENAETTNQHENSLTTPKNKNPKSADPLGRKPGQALCPARFDREALLAKRQKLGSYSFAALYQQSPVPAEGGLFKREWFSRVVDRPPEGLRWFRGYDLAVSTKTSADYTASFRCAFDKKTGDLYIADGFRKRIEFPDQRRFIIERIKEERSTEHGIEEALHGQAFVQELRREHRLAGRAFRGIRAKGDKFTRALAWANRAEAGKVVLVRGPWINDFLEELCLFPHAPHDDQIDAVSLAVQMIESRRMGAYGF